MARRLLILTLCLGACSSSGTSTSDGGGGASGSTGGGGTAAGGRAGAGAGGNGGGGGVTAGSGGGAGSGTAGAGGGVTGSGGAGGSGDQALCTSSCATFTTCGVTIKTTCVADCESASNTYRTCVTSAGTDCNALALCYFQAVAANDCPAGGGVPSGTATCMTTETCQATCNTNSSGPTCRCTCAGAADPSVANLLLGVNSCASNMCSTECSGTGGPDCNTCFDQDCQTPRTACLAH